MQENERMDTVVVVVVWPLGVIVRVLLSLGGGDVLFGLFLLDDGGDMKRFLIVDVGIICIRLLRFYCVVNVFFSSFTTHSAFQGAYYFLELGQHFFLPAK